MLSLFEQLSQHSPHSPKKQHLGFFSEKLISKNLLKSPMRSKLI